MSEKKVRYEKKKIEPFSIFIPVYNSENIVVDSIIKTYDYLSMICNSFELVIVDDNSTDNTFRKILELKKEYPNIRLIKTNKGPSRRENLAQAMKNARYDIIFFQDVDLSVSLDDIYPLIRKVMYEGYDIATGCRYKGKKPEQSLWRLFISKNYNFFLRLFFWSKVKDHQCGFKAFKKKVFLDIAQDMGYDKTLKRGWFWDAELLIRAQRKGYSIYEMPVSWKAGKDSTFNAKREMGMIPYIFRFIWR